MLLLAKVPQTGQFVCSCVAPKHLASPTARSLLEAADVWGFSSNWTEEDFYVQPLSEVTGDDGNPSESRALCIALTARCLYLPPVVYTLSPTPTPPPILFQQASPPADCHSRAAEFGSPSISYFMGNTEKLKKKKDSQLHNFTFFDFDAATASVRLLSSVAEPQRRHRSAGQVFGDFGVM